MIPVEVLETWLMLSGNQEKESPTMQRRHPHINRFDSDCEERARAVLLGATNSWFPITVSVLAIPTEEDPLIQCINDGWEHFHILETKDQLDTILRVLISASLLPGIERFDSNDIWQAIEDKKEGRTSSTVEAEEIKGPEWEIFTKDPPPNDWPYFKSRKVPVPDSYQHWIESVLLVERLREVNALLGFTRIEAPEETQDPDKRPPRASLSKHDPTWVPVTDVHGEGIFIRFKEEVVKAWEEDDTVKERLKMLLEGHRGWRNERKLDPEEGFPRGRYVMLHTLSHILIRELALECGYNAASIRERIYAEDDGVDPQAGILLYTAAADSDGTLGGLVSLGEPDNLKRLLEQALERIALCSSDPLCAEHVPKKIVLFMLQHVMPVVSSLKLHVSGTIAISIAHYWFPPSKQVLNPFFQS